MLDYIKLLLEDAITYLSILPVWDGERKEGGMTKDLQDEGLQVY